MAGFKDTWYTMPLGPDGKRHRVWHRRSRLGLLEIVTSMDFEGRVEKVSRILARRNPLLGRKKPRRSP